MKASGGPVVGAPGSAIAAAIRTAIRAWVAEQARLTAESAGREAASTSSAQRSATIVATWGSICWVPGARRRARASIAETGSWLARPLGRGRRGRNAERFEPEHDVEERRRRDEP